MLKLAGSKEPAPAPIDDAPPADAGFGGEDAQPSSDEKPFDAEPFDAGVEADEESDPKKFIEQLTGKLGQSLRKYNEDQGQPDFELEKFAINSLLSATHTAEMDQNDQDDIIKKVKTAGNDGDNQDDNQDDNSGNDDFSDDGGDFGGGDDNDFGGDMGDSGSEGEDELQENGGSVIDFEGVADSLMNILTSNQFSDESDDRVYALAKKTLENRSIEEKVKLYKTIAIKLQNFSNAFPIAANMASQYYSIASRLEGSISNGLNEMENFILPGKGKRMSIFAPEGSDEFMEVNRLDETNPCWKGYEKVDGKKDFEKGSCRKIKENTEGGESKNYMFWQNLKTIHHASGELLEMNQQQIDDMCANGHAWAVDHISSSADDIEEVYHFFEANINDYDGQTEGGYEDEYGSVEGAGLYEGKYDGKPLGKPMKGDVKKFKVYVKNDKGNVIKVNFGDPNMEIKRDDPENRKSFRARHKCSQAKDRTTPKYWSCKMWSSTPVSKIVGEDLIESKKSSIFVKIKTKLKETFNQEETMSEPMIEPQVKPVVKPAPDKVQPNIAPSRKNKPFLPMPEVKPDPKASN